MTKDWILKQARNPDLRSAMFEVGLRSSAIAARRACLREPCAWDELLLENAGPVLVTELISDLLVEGAPTRLRKEDVWQLSLSDRDRIVARLHARCFGDRVESIVTCRACREPFEIGLSLGELEESVAPGPGETRAADPDANGSYRFTDSTSFRIPTTADEYAVAELSAEAAAHELVRRCVTPQPDASTDLAAIDSAMSAVAPLLDIDVPVSCAHCASEQEVHFEIVSFFISTLARERPILLREIHRIASAYHWSSQEIMALPRSLRRAHVALVEVDRGALRASS